MRCGVVNGSGGTDINEMVCGVQCFDPKRGRQIGLDEESAYDVIGCAKHSFGLAILW
jgi:hypothetical protein